MTQVGYQPPRNKKVVFVYSDLGDDRPTGEGESYGELKKKILAANIH